MSIHSLPSHAIFLMFANLCAPELVFAIRHFTVLFKCPLLIKWRTGVSRHAALRHGDAGSPWELPPRAPTDPDVPKFRHPARHSLASPSRYAIRWRFVNRCLRFDALGPFPPSGAALRRPLPSTGSARWRSPASTVL